MKSIYLSLFFIDGNSKDDKKFKCQKDPRKYRSTILK